MSIAIWVSASNKTIRKCAALNAIYANIAQHNSILRAIETFAIDFFFQVFVAFIVWWRRLQFHKVLRPAVSMYRINLWLRLSTLR